MSRGGFFLLFSLSLLLQGLYQPLARAQQSPAQDNQGQIERSRLPNPLTPVTGGLSVGEPEQGSDSSQAAPAAPGDNDLGILSVLHQAERRQPWTFFADGGFVYTSNVALTNRNLHEDVFFVGEGGVGYEWKLAPDLTLEGTAEEQYFAYDRFNELDFGSLNFALALSYTAHQLDDIVLSGQLGFTRLTHSSVAANEFFRNGGLSLGAQKLFSIGRAQLIGVGIDIDLGLSVPHVAEREEFGLSTTYVVQCTRHLSVQTGVLTAYYLYPATGREDFNFSGTGGASYAFTPWCSLGATVTGTLDRSTRELLAYNVFNAGGTLFLRMHF